MALHKNNVSGLYICAKNILGTFPRLLLPIRISGSLEKGLGGFSLEFL